MRVVVCGIGYGGLTAATALDGSLPADVELLLIDRNPYHLIQHELHRLIRRPDLADHLTIPPADLIDHGIFRQATIEAIDLDSTTITIDDGSEIGYDYAIIGLGAEPAYYGMDDVRKQSIPLKRLEDADRIRRTIEEGDAPQRVIVGGAGLAGVQVAGELAALRDQQHIDLEITLLEQADSVAPGFNPEFQQAIESALRDAAIELHLDTRVMGANSSAIETARGKSIPFELFIWTGGISGPDPLSGTRRSVRSDLRLTARTFAIGDAVQMVDDRGMAVAATAQSAMQAGLVAASNVRKLVEYDHSGVGGFSPKLDRFRFKPKGWVVSIGDQTIALVGSSVLTGRPALGVKIGAGLRYLTAVGAVHEAVDLLYAEMGLRGEVDTTNREPER